MTSWQSFLLGFAICEVLNLILVSLGLLWFYANMQEQTDRPRGVSGLNVLDWLALMRAILGMIWFSVWKNTGAKAVTTAKTIRGKVNGALSKRNHLFIKKEK